MHPQYTHDTPTSSLCFNYTTYHQHSMLHCWRTLIATALLLALASAAIFRPAAIMQRTPHPDDFAEDEPHQDVLAEWEAEDWDFMQDDDEIHASFSPPRRKRADSFFSAVVDDSRDAASKLQNQLSDVSDRAASWYEREKHEANDWLGRFRHSAEKVSDRVADELSANYYHARGKARSAYHDAANQYYRAKSKMRHTGHEGADALVSWKNHLSDAASESDSMRDEIDRMKNRQWLRELGRVLDTEPFEGSRFGSYRPRLWFQRASAEAEHKVEDAYDKGKDLYNQARHKAEDAYWRAKQTAEGAAHRARRRFWS